MHTRRLKPRPRQLESQVWSTFSFSYLLALTSLHFAAVHNKMIISNSAGPINQALDRGRSFARVFGGEIKWVQRVRCTGHVLSRSATLLENNVRWRDLWSADEPIWVTCASRFNACRISTYSTPIVGDLVDMLECCCLRESRVVRALMSVSKSFQIVTFRGSRLRRG
jgi:hypothetical protein